MARIALTVIDDEGKLVKAYDARGDLKTLVNAMNNAIIDTMEITPECRMASCSDVECAPEVIRIDPNADLLNCHGDGLEKDIAKGAGVKGESLVSESKAETEHKTVAGRVMTQRIDKRALTFFRCKHCGEINIGVHTPNEEIKCYHCKEDITVPEGLIHTEYQCDNCSLSAFAFMEMGVMSEVKCKNCKSPIDLVFNEKRGNYMSMNKLR